MMIQELGKEIFVFTENITEDFFGRTESEC